MNKALNKLNLFKKKYYEDPDRKKLLLNQMNITDKDMPELIFFLHTHPEIKTVDLGYNSISPKGAKYFFCHNNTIDTLILTGNKIPAKNLLFLMEQKKSLVNHVQISAQEDKIFDITLQKAPLLETLKIKDEILQKLEEKLSLSFSAKEKIISSLTNTARLGGFVGSIEAILDISKNTWSDLQNYSSETGHLYFKQITISGTTFLGAALEYANLYSSFSELNSKPYRYYAKLSESIMRSVLNTHSIGMHITQLLANAGILDAAANAIFQPLQSISFGVGAWMQVGLGIAKLQRAVKKSDMNYWVKDQIKKYNTLGKKIEALNHQIFMQRNEEDEMKNQKLIQKLENFKGAQTKITHRLNTLYKVFNAKNSSTLNLKIIENFFTDKNMLLSSEAPLPEEVRFIENLQDKQKENVLGNTVDLVLKIMSAIGTTFLALSPLCPPLFTAGIALIATSALISMLTHVIPRISNKIFQKSYQKKTFRDYSPEALVPPAGLSEEELRMFSTFTPREKIKCDMAYALIKPKQAAKEINIRLKLYKSLLSLSHRKRNKILAKVTDKYIEKKILKEAIGMNYKKILSSEEKTKKNIIKNYLNTQKLGVFYKILKSADHKVDDPPKTHGFNFRVHVS